MKYKSELYELLKLMNTLLTEHIRIHDAIFNPSLRARIPIPGIMKKIDFKELYENAVTVQEQLKDCLQTIVDIAEHGTSEDKTTCQGMKEYTICFLASNSKITEIAYELNQKARNENELSFNEYNRLVDQYQENEEQRLNKSGTMNKIVATLSEV